MEPCTVVLSDGSPKSDSSAGAARDSRDTNPAQRVHDSVIKIIIIGASGSGKSTVGNFLLGKQNFPVSPKTNPFVSKTVAATTGVNKSREKHLKVLDTPDIYSEDLKEEPRAEIEIKDWKTKISSKPDLILLTIACHMLDPCGDVKRYNRFKKLWGKDYVPRHLIVLLTFGDKLGNTKIEDFTRDLRPDLKEIVHDAGGRYVVFDSTLDCNEQNSRVDKVLGFLDEITSANVDDQDDDGFTCLDKPDQGINDSHHLDLQNTENGRDCSCKRARKAVSQYEHHLPDSRLPDKLHVHALIIGKTGNGKSKVGNILLKKDAFLISCGLASSTTRTETKTSQIHDVSIKVSDTPDVSNLDLDPQTAVAKIREWRELNPDVILLAVRCDVRYTPEEFQIYKQIKSVLGEKYVCPRLIVAFTFKDRLQTDLNEELKTVCKELKKVLKDARHRHVVFGENDEKGNSNQILELMDLKKATQKVATPPQPKSQHSDAGKADKSVKTLKSCKAEHPHMSLPEALPQTNTCNVHALIIGKTGNGKSTVGNILLKKDAFLISCGLASSTTRTETKTSQIHDVSIKVSDTPDVSNLDLDPQTAVAKIREWRELNPDVILLAVRCDVRYTPEEFQIYKQIKSVLGEKYVCPRLIVAFTFKDRLQTGVDEELKTVCKELKKVLKDARHRHVVFGENDEEGNSSQMLELMRFVSSPSVYN